MRTPVMVNDRRPGRSRRMLAHAGLLSAVAVLGSVGLGSAAFAGPAGWQHRAQVTIRVELYVPPAEPAAPATLTTCRQRPTDQGGNPAPTGRGTAGRNADAGDDRTAAATGTGTAVGASGTAATGAAVTAAAGSGTTDDGCPEAVDGDGDGNGGGDQVTTPHLVAGEAGADATVTAPGAAPAEPTPDPAAEPTKKPTAEPTTKSTPEPTGKPAATSKPKPEPEPEPTTEPTSKPKPTTSEQDGTPTPDASTEPTG